MGSSQSKRSKEPSIKSSSRRSVAVKVSGSSLSTSGRTTSGTISSLSTSSTQHTIKPKTSFIRPSSYAPTSSSSKQQQQQQTQQQDSAVAITRPPIFAGIQSNSFFLPKDWQAEDADHGLHFALKLLFGSSVLSLALPKFTRNASIIELGCNHGSWILDMATQFPDCQFIGFDTSLDRLPDSFPALGNVSFQVSTVGHDDKSSIPLNDGSVDVVNLRAQNAFLDHSGWQRTFEEAYRVLKPVRGIMNSKNRDTDRATKLGAQLSGFGFQVIQTLTKQVQYGSANGKLGEAFTAVTLHRFEEMAHVLAPAMGLSLDDYRHRVEMVVAQCVNANSSLAWYAYVARKIAAPSPSSSAATTLPSSHRT
ncbi:hypothetical protein [Absidia glauca]|uniref:Methyltransferase domain-containing protein n=1 Tax=Absidia glauca TaxID=4829 RepID=A0A168PLZ2_ABSGL|nr:hypothetical protein [Absidia glauca]